MFSLLLKEYQNVFENSILIGILSIIAEEKQESLRCSKKVKVVSSSMPKYASCKCSEINNCNSKLSRFDTRFSKKVKQSHLIFSKKLDEFVFEHGSV